MSDIVKAFESLEFGEVRVVLHNGEPWFIGTDVAEMLGYADPSRAVIQHCKKSIKSTILAKNANGKKTPLNQSIIPESDLYRLIMRSNMPKAVEFQDWVVEEILPNIRKTGQYSIAAQKEDVAAELELATIILKAAGISDNQLALGLDNIAKKKIHKSLLEESQVALPAPVQKAMLTATQVGIEAGGLSGKKVNQLLIDNGYLKRLSSGGLEITDKGKEYGVLLDVGKRHKSGTPVVQVKWYSPIIPIIKKWLDE